MKEWGFIGQDIFVGIGNESATGIKFIQRCGLVVQESVLLSNPHYIELVVSGHSNRRH
jgi:hypothetical protein